MPRITFGGVAGGDPFAVWALQEHHDAVAGNDQAADDFSTVALSAYPRIRFQEELRSG
jgi:hypothetical protein